MCGIVGYTGQRDALPLLVEGLQRLEYRGYDSAGVAYMRDGSIERVRRVGKVSALVESLEKRPRKSPTGIAHTRWATHGVANEMNAHPHCDCSGTIAVVHNGIIENHDSLRASLLERGHSFSSTTDTEVIAHLIEQFLPSCSGLAEAVRLALSHVTGTYGLTIISSAYPDTIIAAKNGSPLVIGVGDGETFVASDMSAVVRQTDRAVWLADGEIAVIRPDGYEISTLSNEIINRLPETVQLDIRDIEHVGYESFMLKEICEQPSTLEAAMRGRIDEANGCARFGGLNDCLDSMLSAKRIVITGCGTSWHAGLVGRYLIERWTRIPVDVEYASEFRYRDPILDGRDVVFAISQSGETADTLAAVREAKRKGAVVFGICNVVGSTLSRESDGGIFLHAGPEIGVASTKAFTSQLLVLTLIAITIGRARGLSLETGKGVLCAVQSLGPMISKVLEQWKNIERIGNLLSKYANALYLGRGLNYPVALEGALKLKEISYIHAEGYPAAEMKHGPIALVDDRMPVVCIAPKDSTYGKVLSNIHEIRARRGKIISIVTEGDTEASELSDHVIAIPPTIEALNPILTAVPLQLLAYAAAVARGCEVDQPRNLAKSVTVE